MAKLLNALTIDVEEYFQVEAFAKVISPKDWENFPPRVEKNVKLILDILEEARVRATFFWVGWVARRYPYLVRALAEQGHEIASHGMTHRPLFRLTPEEFRQEVRESKKILEDLSGCKIFGFRAPTYSITKETAWGLQILAEEGYAYDSSIFPIKHDLYGWPEAPRFPFRVEGLDLIEFPISTYRLGKINFPVAGGGYFRLFPYRVSRFFLKRLNWKEKEPFVFYCHPWEFDPGQPRLPGPLKSKLRHYLNLHRTEKKFRQLLADFPFASMVEVLRNMGFNSFLKSLPL